jgi:hypothetical protein
MNKSISPSKAIYITKYKKRDRLKPLTLSESFVDIKNEIEIEINARVMLSIINRKIRLK